MAILGYSYDSDKDMYFKISKETYIFKWVCSREIEYISKEDMFEKLKAYVSNEMYKPLELNTDQWNKLSHQDQEAIVAATILKDSEGSLKVIATKLGVLKYSTTYGRYRIAKCYKKTYNFSEEDLTIFLTKYIEEGFIKTEAIRLFFETLTPISESTHNFI